MRTTSVATVVVLLAGSTFNACLCEVDPLERPRPHMKVTPTDVLLRDVPVTQDRRIVIQVENDSFVNLDTLRAELRAEDSDPAFSLIDTYPREVFATQTVELVVVVRPVVASTISAVLVVTGDGFDTARIDDDAQPSPIVEVDITVEAVNVGEPDICDYPAEIAFDTLGQFDVGRVSLPFKNCGPLNLLIDSLAYCPEGEAPAAAHVETCTIAGLLDEGAPTPISLSGVPDGLEMPFNSSASAEVLFRPTDLDEHSGNIVILSNDPDESPLLIPVRGEASACPTAVAELVDTVDNSIEPFDTVRLTARSSIASDSDEPGSFEGEYLWTLVAQPQGSTAEVRPDDAEEVEVLTDLGGRYVASLEVFEIDDEGARIRSCEPATVTFDVVPTEELLIQLVWDHPTADVDLQLVRGSDGVEFTHTDACYFSNRTPQQTEEEPDWSAVPEENPVLDVDDDEGYGPENMNIVRPAAGSQWKVLVHYWRATTLQQTLTATVRVFVRGQLILEVDRTLESEEQLWEALDITWPDDDVTPVDIAQLGIVREFPRPF